MLTKHLEIDWRGRCVMTSKHVLVLAGLLSGVLNAVPHEFHQSLTSAMPVNTASAAVHIAPGKHCLEHQFPRLTKPTSCSQNLC